MYTNEAPLSQGRSNASFPRSARLFHSGEFQKVFDHKCNVVGKFMVMWSAENEYKGFRLGVIASKKTFRRAADRNRAKRLIREAFRLNRDRLQGSADLVIVARRRILDMKRQSVDRELLTLACKLGFADSLESNSEDASQASRQGGE
jgi:ribonuclease P protein component